MITESEAIKRFREYSNRFQNLADRIKNPIDLFIEAEKSVVREDFCSGSDMFLGYYCPSLIFDLVVGNVHRGRLLKRITKRSKPTHRYGFDKDNRLRTMVEIPDAEEMNIANRAVLLYEENLITIIHIHHFEEITEIDVMAECIYDVDNKLKQYTVGLMDNSRYNDISQEIYNYSDGGLDTVTMWKCDCLPGGKLKTYIPQIDTYHFHHDSDGYIASYETVGNDFWDGTVFELSEKKRRKI